MKRTVSCLLAGALLLSLAGCGAGAPSSPSPVPATAAPTATLEPAATPGPVATPEPAPTSGPTATPEPTPTPGPAATPEPTPTPTEAGGEDAVPVPAFTTTDLAGNTVTEDIFSQKDLTVVNVWATYCGPCINEMPELGKWAKELPENVQLIGIVGDLSSGDDGELHELAESIMQTAEADFPCLTVSEDLMWILYSISGVPTTFFVDGQGNIVGKAVLGAYVDQYKAQVEELLNGTEG